MANGVELTVQILMVQIAGKEEAYAAAAWVRRGRNCIWARVTNKHGSHNYVTACFRVS